MTTDHQAFKSRALLHARKGRSALSPILSACCSVGISPMRSRMIRLICRLEGGQMWSLTYRELIKRHYHVEVGIHSYGDCLWPGHLPKATRIGNYCSLAGGIVALRRNHTMDRISQHPFFYNSALGLVDPGLIPDLADNPLTIGHDVWIGYNVLITPGCKNIGNSAVVAAGSVVTTDVPPFAVVGGVPAKLIRWRFPEPVREALNASQWWLRPVWDLAEWLDLFKSTASPEIVHSLIKALEAAPREPA